MGPELPEALRVAVLAIRALDATGIAYHIGGSLASSFHGMPRQTNDIDLVVEMNVSHVKALGAALGASFYYDEESATSAIRGRESFNLIHLESGIKVDVFVRGDTDFDLAEFNRRRPEPLFEDDTTVYVKSPEDTILRKLLWYRMGGEVSDRPWSDILGVFQVQGAGRPRVPRQVGGAPSCRGSARADFLKRLKPQAPIGE